jgi:hypothetical protein
VASHWLIVKMSTPARNKCTAVQSFRWERGSHGLCALWREITEAITNSHVRYPDPTTTMWEFWSKRYAQGFSSTKGVNAQGFHSKRVTILADEAIGISSEIWDAIEGIRSAGDVRLVMLLQPNGAIGPGL